MAAIAAGDKGLFAGGQYYSRMVDIVHLTTHTWFEVHLDRDLGGATVAAIKNKVYFGGFCTIRMAPQCRRAGNCHIYYTE